MTDRNANGGSSLGDSLTKSKSKPKTETSSSTSAVNTGISSKPVRVALDAGILRRLSDRSYDRRKAGALDVESLVKTLIAKGQHKVVVSDVNGSSEDAVTTLVNSLIMDLICAANATKRKGGLFGLAGIALGLGPKEISFYLPKLLPPILKCFDDPESRVRYYACESLYNVCKVARGRMLSDFNEIFDGLCKLYADVEVDVKNGAQLLDRLLKDIVTESTAFDVNEFMPLVERYLRMTNPYIRQLLVSWMLALDAVPAIDMLEHLPKYLNGIFNMLSDGNIYIRQAADQALSEFLKEVQEDADRIDLGLMVPILVGQSLSPQKFNRITAMSWLLEFVKLQGPRLGRLFHEILSAVLFCISDTEVEIRNVAAEIDNILLNSVETQDSHKPMQLESLLAVIQEQLQTESSSLEARKTALKWVAMLLDRQAEAMALHIPVLSSIMLATLSEPSDEIVVLTVEVLARIARNTDGFDQVLRDIVRLFYQNASLLERRGSFVVRKLSTLLRPDKVYVILARVLRDDFAEEVDFISMFIQTLNLILLTAPELQSLRVGLQSSWSVQIELDIDNLFVHLYRTWTHNPISALSLCLLAEAYELANDLIQHLSQVKITVGLLMEIDKLVDLMESPVFIKLRLHLIQTGKEARPYLLKALYGLLMLLPQSEAYETLRKRLDSATALHLAISSNPHATAESDGTGQKSTTALVVYFKDVQTQHMKVQEHKYQSKSILPR